jgi:flavoprotein
MSLRTATHSVTSLRSAEHIRGEITTSHSIEEDIRVRELEEQVRKQSEDNEKNNQRMQDLEDPIGGQVRIKRKEDGDDGNATVTSKIKQASPLQQTQESCRAANLSRHVVPENHAQEVVGYTIRIKELEQIVDNNVERIQDLEVEVRTQAESIVALEEERRLRDGPDIAALGAELAFARGVDKGDRAGVVARLPSARLSGEAG